MQVDDGPAVGISAHHGNLTYPNELRAAQRLCERYDEIDCLEIDFVTFRGQVRSSHDYDEQMIARGSPLEEWLRYVAAPDLGGKQLVLWIDVKENEWFYFNGMYGHFDVTLFFQTLCTERRRLWREKRLNVTPLVWIGCQNRALRDQLKEANDALRHPWHLVLDLPLVKSYVYKALLPGCMHATLSRLAQEEILNSPYRRFGVISIDREFFADDEALIEFLYELRLRKHTRVILNSYPRSQPFIRVKGLTITMQYDYRMK